MATKRKKSTQIEKEYKKQRKRIQRFVKSAEKRGYVFTDNVLPSIPKKITQGSINRLQKLTPKELYKKAVYIVPETGEAVGSRFGLYRARQEGIKKRQETIARNIYEKAYKQQFPGIQFNPIEAGDDITDLDYYAESDNQPVVNKWELIRQRLLENFPERLFIVQRRGVGYFVELSSYKNELLNIWEETDEAYFSDRIALNKYAETIESEFSEAVSDLFKVSDQQSLDARISKIAKLLSPTGLSDDQRVRLNDITYNL